MSFGKGKARHLVALGLVLTTVNCAPRLRPLAGAPAPEKLPSTTLPPGHRRIIFRWELEDQDLVARGEGAARIAAPDSGRLDFFLAAGGASGAAVLVGDTLRLPSQMNDLAQKLIPPAPLLWATLGRLAIPALRDTVARVDSTTLRADIGRPVTWRVTFVRDTMRKLERVDGGRVLESVERLSNDHVRYRHETSHRKLDLFITRSEEVSAFDPIIWELP
jgi:hypothetical protein